MSQATSMLSKPIPGQRVPESTFAYFRTRNRMRVFSLVHEEFEKSGIDQAELATRLGKSRTRVCRLLGSPGNWEHDTTSDLLFAISGGEVEYGIGHPFSRAPRNQRAPEWLDPEIPVNVKAFTDPKAEVISVTTYDDEAVAQSGTLPGAVGTVSGWSRHG
jgi:hypothetical protein